MWLKCDMCGNVYSSPPRFASDQCGVNYCYGMLKPFAQMNMVQCNICGNVYSGQDRKIGTSCGVSHCKGILVSRPGILIRR